MYYPDLLEIFPAGCDCSENFQLQTLMFSFPRGSIDSFTSPVPFFSIPYWCGMAVGCPSVESEAGNFLGCQEEAVGFLWEEVAYILWILTRKADLGNHRKDGGWCSVPR